MYEAAPTVTLSLWQRWSMYRYLKSEQWVASMWVGVFFFAVAMLSNVFNVSAKGNLGAMLLVSGFSFAVGAGARWGIEVAAQRTARTLAAEDRVAVVSRWWYLSSFINYDEIETITSAVQLARNLPHDSGIFEETRNVRYALIKAISNVRELFIMQDTSLTKEQVALKNASLERAKRTLNIIRWETVQANVRVQEYAVKVALPQAVAQQGTIIGVKTSAVDLERQQREAGMARNAEQYATTTLKQKHADEYEELLEVGYLMAGLKQGTPVL